MKGIKKSSQAIAGFEEAAIQLARDKGHDYIVCGYIHQPIIKAISKNNQTITYMNSGDWVENLSALEFRFGKWQLYQYDELDFDFINPKLCVKSKKNEKKIICIKYMYGERFTACIHYLSIFTCNIDMSVTDFNKF